MMVGAQLYYSTADGYTHIKFDNYEDASWAAKQLLLSGILTHNPIITHRLEWDPPFPDRIVRGTFGEQ